VPRRELFASGVCIVQLRSTLARAELFLLAPFAPTSEPAPLVAACLLFGHVVLLSRGTRSSASLRQCRRRLRSGWVRSPSGGHRFGLLHAVGTASPIVCHVRPSENTTSCVIWTSFR
jgi:hypothetical protein